MTSTFTFLSLTPPNQPILWSSRETCLHITHAFKKILQNHTFINTFGNLIFCQNQNILWTTLLMKTSIISVLVSSVLPLLWPCDVHFIFIIVAWSNTKHKQNYNGNGYQIICSNTWWFILDAQPSDRIIPSMPRWDTLISYMVSREKSKQAFFGPIVLLAISLKTSIWCHFHSCLGEGLVVVYGIIES